MKHLADLPDFMVLPRVITSQEIPSWDNFFAAANAAAERRDTSNRVGNPMAERQINDLVMMGLTYMYFYMENEEKLTLFKKLLPLQEQLQQIFPRKHKKFSMATAFITLLREDAQAGPHADNTHNLYVQCHGSSEWTIHQGDENYSELGTFHLGPGDGIFVASGVYHSVRAKEARAAVTFRMDVEDIDV